MWGDLWVSVVDAYIVSDKRGGPRIVKGIPYDPPCISLVKSSALGLDSST